MRSKPRRIAAVLFEDGERWEAPGYVSEFDRLTQILHAIEQLRLEWGAFTLGLDPAMGPHIPAAYRSHKASERAKNPRKPETRRATKAALQAHRAAWLAAGRPQRSWLKAAAIEFGISEDTIRRRMTA